MAVTGVGRLGAALPARAAVRSAGGFGVPAGAQGTGGAAAATAAAALDGLLLLQEGDDPTARDRRGRRHGHAVLDALSRLQCGLLDGADLPDGLRHLASLAAAPADAADPALRSLLGAIRLRAEVELARHGA